MSAAAFRLLENSSEDHFLPEDDARLELACRFFDANRLTLHQAANWAGLDRLGMEAALVQRGLPIYRYTEEDLQGDLETIKHFGEALT